MYRIPKPLLTDSYKMTHKDVYPDATKMVAYSEFRTGFDKDVSDTRMVFYGIRYIIENYIAVPWTQTDLDQAVAFCKTHRAGLDGKATEFPFPKDLFQQIIDENGGYFPVTIQALPEGSVIYPHTPVMQIMAEGKYARLVTYLESILMHLWYPCTVATLSRRCKDTIDSYYKKTVDPDAYFTLNSRLHDFGFRGCTSVEQTVIGGCAHLLNFDGTDTVSAAWYAQFQLNDGIPVAVSIPATEHSVMTAYPNERLAMLKLIEMYGDGFCACVMDSYDYSFALESVLPSIKKVKLDKGGFLVLRPDSGDAVDVVLQGLRAADTVFGSTINNKGYRVIHGCSVIQGDGIDFHTITHILAAVEQAGYSAQNVAFGMGGGLLQKVNRDTMSFATKLSHITYADGTSRDVMKMPKTDTGKFSLPGEFRVETHPFTAVKTVYPCPSDDTRSNNALEIVYDKGPCKETWDSFSTVRERLDTEWRLSRNDKQHDCISSELRAHIQKIMGRQEKGFDPPVNHSL